MKTIGWTVRGFSVLLIVLHVWAALFPSHWNWGLHLYGFYPLPISLAVLLLSVLIMIPSIQERVLRWIERFAAYFGKRPTIIVVAILCVVLVALAFLVPAQLHLLGDGALLVRVLSGNRVMDEVPPNFHHQPGVGVVFQFLVNYMQSGTSLSAEKLFQELGIASGILFLVLMVVFLRSLRLTPSENVLVGFFLFCTAGSQFFFGYVELYVLLYITTFAYLVSAWYVFEKTLSTRRLIVHSIVSVLCFALMCAWHYASIVFAPSLLLLLMAITKQKRSIGFVFFGMMLLSITAAIWVKRDSLGAVMETLTHETWYNFLPFFTRIEYFPYTMFSVAHLVDWLNAQLLVVPFGLILVLALFFFAKQERHWNNLTKVFYLSTAVLGLGFTFAMNPALGLARDWDFLASFFLPLVFLCIILSKQFFAEREFKSAFVVIVVVSLLHWTGWIGVNASGERHLKRVLVLNDTTFLSHVPRLNYYETLGNFFWYHGNYAQSRVFWEQYYAVDSTNYRTVANLSEVYRKLGETEKTFLLLKRASELGSRSPAIYMNLGVMYAQRGDTTAAIAYNKRALSMDSMYAKAHANLGFLYSKRRQYQEAAVHLQKAISYGLEEPFIFREMGSVNFFLNKFEMSLAYYNRYLELVPNDTTVKNIRDRLEAYIKSINQ